MRQKKYFFLQIFIHIRFSIILFVQCSRRGRYLVENLLPKIKIWKKKNFHGEENFFYKKEIGENFWKNLVIGPRKSREIVSNIVNFMFFDILFWIFPIFKDFFEIFKKMWITSAQCRCQCGNFLFRLYILKR